MMDGRCLGQRYELKRKKEEGDDSLIHRGVCGNQGSPLRGVIIKLDITFGSPTGTILNKHAQVSSNSAREVRHGSP